MDQFIMARMPRLVVPRYPHHVTQRGNRRQQTFFGADDYNHYINLVVDAKVNAGVEVLAYCLMPNHVHFIVVPQRKDSLAKLFSEAHRQYTRRVNFREGWRGHLWQERFFSCVMDEQHLIAAVRYVELNPVRSNLCDCPAKWPWSSVVAHLNGRNDRMVNVAPMLDLVGNWSDYLSAQEAGSRLDTIRQRTRTGRPAGSTQFLETLENKTGLSLRKKRPGRPSRKNQ